MDHFLEYGPEKEVELEKLFYDEIKNEMKNLEHKEKKTLFG